MGKGTTLFAQLQALMPWAVMAQAVQAVRGDFKVHRTTCRSYFLVLLLALLRGQHSLRDIERGLSGRQRYLRAFGLGSLDRSTLSHAGQHRPAEVAEAVFSDLLRQVSAVAPRHPGRFRGKHYTLDATEIPVPSTLVRWARCAPDEAGIKLHLFLDHDGLVPCLVEFATVKDSELKLARQRSYPRGTLLCFDRGYFDSAWFKTLTDAGVIFVTRLPQCPRYAVEQARPVAEDSAVLFDEIIRFTSPACRRQYPGRLRLITYYDAVGNRTLQFLTNQMRWAATTLCQIYKERWQIELFFKWLKQNLRLTHFLGCTENAVRWQVLVALCLYLLLALLKFRHRLSWSLRELLGRLGQYLFDPVTLHELFAECYQFQT